MEHAMKELGPIAVHQVSYLWLIPLFPLVGATVNALVGWKLQRVFGKRAVHLVAVGAMLASLLVALRAFAQLLGARVLASYNVQQMEFKDQDFNLHQTGSLRKMAEFKTADNFTGYLLIDAQQVIPGQKNLKEREEYMGSFEISRRIVFRDMTPLNAPCLTGDCFKIGRSLPIAPVSGFASPCMSGSCNDFVTRLNAFTQPG